MGDSAVDKQFESFLESIDLESFRDTYAPVKIVEMDLPRNIWVLEQMYKTYWEERRHVGYQDFYQSYLEQKRDELEIFRTKIQMCDNCFYLGLPARLYRTWTALLTQIHAGFVAEKITGVDQVQMSEKLDSAGVDMRIFYKD